MAFLLSTIATLGMLSAVFCYESRQIADLVTALPGQPQVNFNHYAGYVNLRRQQNKFLFYWFFEAASNKEKKPLFLWLNGGPGCSSIGYGATQEIGPFLLNGNRPNLTLNIYSWNQEANLLFVESPVGVGFSYSIDPSDYDSLGDSISAADTYAFLQNWLQKFPQYRTRDFYIGGESYGGKYVPELAELIYVPDDASTAELHINLKGFLVGNPETDDELDWKGFVDYAWSHAIISDETYKSIKETCHFDMKANWIDQCGVKEITDQYEDIDIFSLYTPACVHPNSSGESELSYSIAKKKPRKPIVRQDGFDPCLDDYAADFYNRVDVQRALHVINGSEIKSWDTCNYDIYLNWKETKYTVLPIYQKLIQAGLRIWLYSGDTDGRVPVLSTRYCLNALNLTKTGRWRPWYHQHQVGGWVQEYQGLTYATFRGAGHDVPSFKPSESLAFFRAFLRGVSLPSDKWQM